MKELKEKLSKFKWIIYWVLSASAMAIGLCLILLEEFRTNAVFILTGVVFIVFVLIRFIPLINTARNRWAITSNAIEMFIDFACGALVIFFSIKSSMDGETSAMVKNAYPFLIGGALYIRSVVYFLETSFFGTKPKASYFVLHLALISLGTWIMASYRTFTSDYFGYVFACLALVSSVYGIYKGFRNFSEFKKEFLPQSKKKEKKEDKKNIQEPIEEDDIPTIQA